MKFLAMAAGIVSPLMKNAGRIREFWPTGCPSPLTPAITGEPIGPRRLLRVALRPKLPRRTVAHWATVLVRFSIYLCMIDTPHSAAAARGAQLPLKRNLGVNSEGVA